MKYRGILFLGLILLFALAGFAQAVELEPWSLPLPKRYERVR